MGSIHETKNAVKCCDTAPLSNIYLLNIINFNTINDGDNFFEGHTVYLNFLVTFKINIFRINMKFKNFFYTLAFGKNCQSFYKDIFTFYELKFQKKRPKIYLKTIKVNYS